MTRWRRQTSAGKNITGNAPSFLISITKESSQFQKRLLIGVYNNNIWLKKVTFDKAMATDERDTKQNVQAEVLGTDASEKIKSGGFLTTSEIVGMINLFKKPYKKRAGKFQPFKKFFGKRKKRDATSDCEEAKLKPSHSFGNVCNGLSSDEETNNGLRSSNYTMGTRAFSHDSIFIPDGQAESEQAVQAMSQDKILGKVKTLQQQLSKTIKFGQPPQMTISERTMEEANTSLEEDFLLSSPMEIETQQDTVLSDSDNNLSDTPDSLNPMSVPGTGHEVEKKVTPVKSSRSKRHISSGGTIESINLDAVPQAVARLDNSAAKHKLSIRPKKQRLSRKHRRLTKESQSVTMTEFEQENPETHQHRERYPDDNGCIGTAKPTQNREGQKQLELVDEKRKQEDHRGMLEAKEKRQIAEAEEKKHLEEQRFQEIEEMQREQERKRCEEEKRQHLLEEEKHLKIKEQKPQEEQKRQQEEQRRQELEEQKTLEEQRQQELEEQKRLEEFRQQEQQERRRVEMEEQKRLEEFRQQEQQERRQVELEEQKIKELEEQRCHEIEKQHQEEQKRQELEEQRQEFEKRHLQAEQKLQQEEEAKRLEEQSQHQTEKKKRQEEQTLQKLEKQKTQEKQRRHEPAEQMHLESEEREQQGKFKIRQEESNEQELKEQTEIHVDGQQHLKKQKEQEQAIRQQQVKEEASSGDAGRESMEKQLQEESNQQKTKRSQKGKETVQEKLTPKQKREVEAQEQKIGEELRWQEVDERQAMHRPFTFQVSSGEKQIIFQKVNLSPVTPVKEAAQHSTLKESKTHKFSKGSTALPYSLCVPHTAILVTGAQLCGTAVNLNQIKDTACKSLLGLTEERKNLDIPPPESTQKTTLGPKSSRSKMKYTQETLNNQDILAEWASIRSRILKSAENSKLNEEDRVSVCRYSDDWTPKGRGASHGNLRKTLSANAKFSITPAWQKFSETSKANADAESSSGAEGTEPENTRKKTDSSNDANDDVAAHYETSACKDNATEMAAKSETHFIMANNTEGYKFAKDLPSFLVPSLSHSPGKELPQSESPATLESQQNTGTRKLDKTAPHEEENISPFGIKLRRTNYSLRFHYDQQAEQKKKKRYSAGDSFDGVLAPLVTTESGKETINTSLKDNISPSLERRDATVNVLKDSSNNVLENSETTVTLLFPSINSQFPLPSHEKPVCKSSLQQKPALAPKPTNQTPPSSPLSKMNRSNLADTLGQRAAKPESDTTWKKEDSKVNVVHSPAQNENKNEEEETREKKSFFSSITMPWRERADKKPEPLKKEKPVLQSRHSLDGSKLMEKVESAQPLWITLALQKQKGFREQQATREERRQAREAKQAEKLAKDNAAVSNQSDNKGSNISKTSAPQKPTPQEDEKNIEMAVSRLERREQLKKSNTLPTSVTVEISDSVSSIPLAKEVTKRFSTPDANLVSTEPAWLALAKRKAKAWSDCPQIIK
ncbi:capping protein-inhibiting regulator of actin dynamics isoform X1 [Chelonoidis abingdonii]|uniref:capping protein-inhibiting regulator of actin dynamics isoform X1 n=2 Tax=Chelonoidis abingdonii TaxID=106734 RepID=UPI0013F1E76F|nr:cancer-related regulator of actin dynamics isoform X1 [Chelonoidis abingdonii]